MTPYMAHLEAKYQDLVQRMNAAGSVDEKTRLSHLAKTAAKDHKRKGEGWKQAKPYWNSLRFDEIDEDTSQGYMLWRNRATNTMRNELALVRTALHWAAEPKQNLLAKIEVPRIIVPAIPESSVDHLSKPQFRKFLEGTRAPHVRLFAILSVTTGGRPTAVLETKWDQIDFNRGLLDLNPKGRDQNRKRRVTVALNDRALTELKAAKEAAISEFVIESGGGSIASIKKGVGAAAERSGIPCHPYMFRHSAAVWMAEDRTPMDEIASFLGNSVEICRKVYARYHPDYLRRAAASLDW